MPRHEKLNFLETLAITMGTILTTAVFLLPATIAGLIGFGSMWLWIIIGILTSMMGLCFAELASMFSRGGGPFLFVRTAFGDFWGFVAGWSTWLYSTIAVAAISLVTSFYISAVLPLSHFQVVALSVGLLAFFTLTNWFGVKFGARMEILFILIGLFILVLYVVLGYPSIDFSRFLLEFPGLPLVGLAALLAIEPFIGWETSTIIAEEVKNPRKRIPQALVITVVVLTLLYLAVIAVFLGNADPAHLGEPNPLAAAAAGFAGPLAAVFSVGAIFIGVAAMNSWIMTVARLPFFMARHRMFPRSFGRLNRHGAPHRSLVAQFLLGAALVSLGSVDFALEILLTVAVFLYLLTLAAQLRLRSLGIERLFKVPVILPWLSIAVLAGFLFFVHFEILLLGAVLLVSGLPTYILIKLYTDREFVVNFWDTISDIWVWIWPLLYGDGERKAVVRNALLRDKMHVLDYGAGTGYTTRAIARVVPHGKIVAADISHEQLKKAIHGIHERLPAANIEFVQIDRPAPFPKGSFDRVVSTVAINYFVHPEKELKALLRTLRKGGVGSFLAIRAPLVIFHSFLRSDRLIKETFSYAGWKDTAVAREKKFLREYIFITAKK